MAKRFFRRFMPHPHRVHRARGLGHIRHTLQEPSLWHLNRHSTSRGIAVGVFWSFIPVPGQTLWSILTAIQLRGNVAAAFVMPWIAPVVLFPAFWVSYRLGLVILHQPPMDNFFDHFPSWNWFWTHRGAVLPFLVGSVPVASVLGVIGYFVVQGVWRWSLSRRWRQRGERMRRRSDQALAVTASE